MKMIPCATAITLTAGERAVLEALSRSTKSEVRLRTRARIVLLAAGGMPTREIGRLDGASFHSVGGLKAHINSLIASYNDDARPFHWTKSEVYQKRLKPCFAVQ